MRERSTTRVVTGIRAAALFVGILGGVSTALVAAQHNHETTAPPAPQALKSDQATDNGRLRALVDTMNAAPAAGKVEAMAAVITELVAERAETRKKLDDMARTSNTMAGRMQGMMGRMRDMQKMSAECPMMQTKPSDQPSDKR